jgi:hypothetical protein
VCNALSKAKREVNGYGMPVLVTLYGSGITHEVGAHGLSAQQRAAPCSDHGRAELPRRCVCRQAGVDCCSTFTNLATSGPLSAQYAANVTWHKFPPKRTLVLPTPAQSPFVTMKLADWEAVHATLAPRTPAPAQAARCGASHPSRTRTRTHARHAAYPWRRAVTGRRSTRGRDTPCVSFVAAVH